MKQIWWRDAEWTVARVVQRNLESDSLRRLLPIPIFAVLLLASGCVREQSKELVTVPPRGEPQRAASAPRETPQPQPAVVPATGSRLLPSSDEMTDTVITANVKAGVLRDPALAGADVSVNTDRGVVSLTGIVASQEQAAVASAHAQRQDGVMRVDNHLTVNLR